jgi:DNA-binding SARP family transcriptional activator/tetratricopeptide (TPR) repeat protein
VEGRRAHRRERLAELLWPNVSAGEARHSLATALSILRPRLGPGAIEASRDHVLLTDGRLDLDLDRLMAGDILGDESHGPLEVAGFLEGFEIPDSGEFGLWKDREQARLLPKIMSGFGVLVDHCRRRGDSRQIEQLANRMLALDELCEEAIRARMEALTFAGDRLAALRVYEEWRLKLSEELGAAPSEQLESMAAHLRARGWERAPVADIPDSPLDRRRARAFVGRSSEYRVMYEAWESVREGRVGHVMVLGDSGVGKTTLVERLTTAAGLEGAAISRVQCYDLERDIPYATVAGLVSGLLARPAVLGTPPEALAELARTVPQVRQRFPSLPLAREVQGETVRIEFTESFQQLLEALTDESPVVLVVDDFHLADDASLAVLHLLARRMTGHRLMLILLARPGEITPTSQAARLRDASPKLGVRDLEMSPLSEDESSELLNHLTDDSGLELTSSLRRILIEAAAGFPMLLELLLQDWRQHGDKALAIALQAMTADLGAGRENLVAYQHLLNSMLKTVEPTTKRVLQVASLLGPRLNELPMYSLANLSLGQAMSGLAQLTELRILRDSMKGLEFANELIRAQVYALIPSPIRRALHGALADRLLGGDPIASHSTGLEVAWHCVRAGRQHEAIPHLMRGAKQAMRHGAPHVAERALESALPALPEEERVDALMLLVESLQEQGRWRESLDRLSALSTVGSQVALWQSAVLDASAKMNLGTAFLDQARERLPDLLIVLRDCTTTRTRVQAARVLAYLASHDSNRQLAQELLTLLDSTEFGALDEDASGELALTRGLLLFSAGETARSREEVGAMIGDLQRRGTANLVAVQLLGGLGNIRAREGRYEDALACYEQAIRMATRLGNDTQLAMLMGNLAICCGRLGLYNEQLRWSSTAPQPWGSEFGGFPEIQHAYCQAFALAMQGASDKALQVIHKLESRISGALQSWIDQAWCLWKADLLLLAGLRAEAMNLGQRATEGYDFRLLSARFAGPFSRWIARLHHKVESRERLVACMQEFLSALEEYDALDRVEILCAELTIEPDPTRNSSRRVNLIEQLARLPLAVSEQLRRLEALPSV